jgi:hypothetical protein
MNPPSRYRKLEPTGTFRPMVPDLPSVERALQRALPLASLMQRLRASQACLEAILPVLGAGLAAQVQAGPIDEEGWTVLAANAAVSAKLRQLQPRLIEALARQGLKVNAIRVKVQKR